MPTTQFAPSASFVPLAQLVTLAAASFLLPLTARASLVADRVVSYQPGSGASANHREPAAALGEPARFTPGQFGGPVDQFSPPYLPDQIVSIGAGGSLTLEFSGRIADDPSHLFGLDFVIFGNAGFAITNGNFTGGGITDGSLFSGHDAETRVSVSADGVEFYELSPSLAPVFDGLYPTDGLGDVYTPVDPAWSGPDFAGRDLAGIRALYRGAAGGTGYDLAWARTASGQPAGLASVQYVRLEVLRGVAEVDAITAVPEPGAIALAAFGGLCLVAARAVRKR